MRVRQTDKAYRFVHFFLFPWKVGGPEWKGETTWRLAAGRWRNVTGH